MSDYAEGMAVWRHLIRRPECFRAAWAYEGALRAFCTPTHVPYIQYDVTPPFHRTDRPEGEPPA